MLTVRIHYFKLFLVCKTTNNYNNRMKTCSICSVSKPESEFFFRNKKIRKLHSQCKDCFVANRRKTWRDHYHKYGSKYREHAIERNRKIKNNLRAHMLDYLRDKSCANCGMNDARVLEFDHIVPAKKSFSIARAMASTFSWERIMNEITKCQILCANCHKIKTAQEGSWYRNP